MALEDSLPPHGIVLLVLDLVGHGILPLVGPNLFVRGALHLGIDTGRGIFRNKGSSLYICDLTHRRTGGQPGGNLTGSGLAHAVHQQVGLAVKEHRTAHLVFPVVIVGKAAQRGLQAADDQRNIPIDLPHLVGIHDGGPVGAKPGLIARGIGVVVPPLLGHGVVSHHGVQVAGGQHDAQSGPPKSCKGLRPAPVRLGQDGHPVALGLQHPGDDGAAEGGMIHVGVAGDDQEVVPVPATLFHIRLGDGQKSIHIVPLIRSWPHSQCIFPKCPGSPGRAPPPPSQSRTSCRSAGPPRFQARSAAAGGFGPEDGTPIPPGR